ncbi:MAG: DUF2585 family protein [Blastocatellia bacterium]|nr:DUF2585 family protein [Blastocatellia bacterium]
MESSEVTVSSKQNLLLLLLTVAVTVLMVILLCVQDRIWWCKFGDYAIYINEAWNNSHTSQHLFDPYTFTHILHGVMFFWLAGVIFSRLKVNWQFFIAISAEAAWEVFENSNFIIEKYRKNTASVDYFGDSIFNSVGDLAACAVGFWIAFKLGWRRSLVFFFAVEIALLLWIRDSLVLNIVMLIFPLEAIKEWQMLA